MNVRNRVEAEVAEWAAEAAAEAAAARVVSARNNNVAMANNAPTAPVSVPQVVAAQQQQHQQVTHQSSGTFTPEGGMVISRDQLMMAMAVAMAIFAALLTKMI